ncbi:hypothetical protein NGH46_13540 [Staphylococcus xylosus]|uniref:hypothetical protein n=1 Tax=Staphylococcus xylosus TaxID=1288 RepID=UPI002DBD0022|nr:hypothetical protein [Staphylococcus xylosus]MEB8123140.1 hypothetical protein [Staphylococcus xylosus]
MFKKNKQLQQSNELCEKEYEAFDLLADRIKASIIHIENEFQKSIDKNIELNNSAFSMYLSNLINLKNTLDYELLRNGSDESTKDMEVYKSLEGFIYDCRMLVANNSFEFDETHFERKIKLSQGISSNEIKRYINISLSSKGNVSINYITD